MEGFGLRDDSDIIVVDLYLYGSRNFDYWFPLRRRVSIIIASVVIIIYYYYCYGNVTGNVEV